MLFLLASLALAGAPAWAAGGPELNVGFVGNLTGADAGRAQDALDGFRLAVKTGGGRLGGLEFGLTVIDAKHDEDTLRTGIEHLTGETKAQVILVSSEPRSTALAASMATASRVFMLSLEPPAPQLAGKECSPYFFSLAGLLETEQELAGQYLQGQGYHKIVLAGPGDAVEHASADSFRRGFRGEIVEVTSRRGEMNFADSFRRIREVKPDAIYLLHTGGMAVNFILQADAAKLKAEMPIYGPGTTLDQTTLAASGAAGLDLFSVGPWSDDFDIPASRRMMADFEAEFGRPASLFAAQGYDAGLLLDAAFHQVDKKFNDDDALRAAIRRVEYGSTRGSLRFDTNHFPIQSYVLRQSVRDARGRITNEQRGQVVHDARDGHAAECPMRWIAEPPAPPKGPVAH